MPRAPVLHLRGPPSSLMHGMVERLLRTNAQIVVEESLHRRFVDAYAADLEFGQAILSSSATTGLEGGHRLVMIGPGPFTSLHDGSNGLDVDGLELILMTPAGMTGGVDMDWVDVHVTVHDMIPMRNDPVWMPAIFQEWLSDLTSGRDAAPSFGLDRWWVSEIDVADAMVRLLMSDDALPQACEMSGRRAWSLNQTHEEFQMLYLRTMAGQSGQFGVQELTAAPTPHIELQSLAVSDTPPMSGIEHQQLRPDLSAIHTALHSADGDGWRPLVPVRTSLMHCLAGLLNA